MGGGCSQHLGSSVLHLHAHQVFDLGLVKVELLDLEESVN